MVAEYMGIPHVSEIQGITYDENMADSMIAIKKAQGMESEDQVPCRLLMSVCFGCNEPRLATLRTKRAAKSKPMEVYTNAELQMDASEIGLAGFADGSHRLFAPESTRRAEMLTGTPEELARKLHELIEIEKGKE